MSNLLLFSGGSARKQANAYIKRVVSDGGIVVNDDYVVEYYRHMANLGLSPRRWYSALAGVKLNGISNTNLLLRSQEFDNATWLKSAGGSGSSPVVTQNAGIAPDGTLTAERIVFDCGAGTASTDFSLLRQNVTVAASSHAQSFYLKSNTGSSQNIAIRFDGGGIETYVLATTSWQRFSITGTPSAGSRDFGLMLRGNSSVGNDTADILVWGAQLQTGTIATDYILSEGTQGVATQSYVQTLYDLNNASPIDAVQSTAANQPYWGLDTDTGFRVPLFDGSNDFMSVNDLGIFNAQAAGTMIAVAKDLNRTGGDASHFICLANGAGGVTRAELRSRITSASLFGALGRRLDTDTTTSSTLTSLDGYNYLAASFIWGGNIIQLTTNATIGLAGTYSSGAGITSATDSANFSIGALNATTSRLNGYVAELPIFRTALSAAQIQSLRTFYKQYYPTLP